MQNRFEWNGEIPEWAKTERVDGVIWAGAPRFYRVDRGEGQFYVGTEAKGETLQAQVFDWRWDYARRWGRNEQTWLDLAFVDSEGVASILAINKASAVNVFDFLISLKQTNHSEIDSSSLRIVFGLQELQTIEALAYYQIRVESWTFVSQKEWLDVAKFRDSRAFAWVLTGEIE